MPRLTLLQGGPIRPSAHEQLHVELTVARAERLVLADKLRGYTRSALRLLSTGHLAAAGTYLEEVERLAVQDGQRALAMSPPCACGVEGSGHGPADSDALAEPVEDAAERAA